MTNGITYDKLRERKINSWKQAGLISRVAGTGKIEDARISKKKMFSYSPEQIWKLDLDYMIKNAQSPEDIGRIGDKIAEAKDKNYDVDLFDYTLRVSQKAKEIGAIEKDSPQEREYKKIPRSDLSKIFKGMK